MEAHQKVSCSDFSSDEEDWSQSIDKSTFQLVKAQESSLNNGSSIKNQCQDVMKRVKGSDEHCSTIVHIDIDCFYAQVEMIRNPELRGKPLGVQQKNIIVTSNYEARAHGVGKLAYLKDAKKACPDLCIVNGEDLTHYRDMSYKITAILTKFSGTVERLGFDENFVDVSDMVGVPPWTDVPSNAEGFVYRKCDTDNSESLQSRVTNDHCSCGCHRRLTIASHIAAEMRKTLFTELGITCCAGVAHNKLLAKLVGGTHKPNQQTVLYPGHVAELMSSLQELRKIPGLGHKTCQRLESLGVSSVSALQSVSLETLQDEFGPQTAQTMQNLSRGIDDSKVVKTGQPQSISDEDSFRRCDTVCDVKTKMSELLDNVIRRLDVDGRIPQTLRITVRKLVPGVKYPNRQSRQGPIPPAYFRKGAEKREKLLELSMQLFEKLIDITSPFHLTLINICVTNFTNQTDTRKRQIDSFFTSPSKNVQLSVNSEKQVTCENKPSAVLDIRSPKPDQVSKTVEEVQGNMDIAKVSQISRKQVCSTEKYQKKEMVPGYNFPKVGSFSDNSPCSTIGQQCFESKGFTSSRSGIEQNQTVRDESCKENVSSLLQDDSDCDAIINHRKCENMPAKETGEAVNLSYLKAHLGPETEFEVFLELPLDIQREIILSHRPPTETVVQKMLSIVESLHSNNNSLEKPVQRNTMDGTCSGIESLDKATTDNKGEELNTINNATATDVPGQMSGNDNLIASPPGFKALTKSSECILASDLNVMQNAIKAGEIQANSDRGECSQPRKEEMDIIPPGYDASVFRELPTHIQKSLLTEYKTTSEFQTMKKRKLDSQSPGGSKKENKKRTSTGDIATFFKKRS